MPFGRAKLSLLAGGRGTLCDCAALNEPPADEGRGILLLPAELPAALALAVSGRLPAAEDLAAAPVFEGLFLAFSAAPRDDAAALPRADADCVPAKPDWCEGGVARVTTERLAVVRGTPVVRGVCPPRTEDRVGLTLAVFIMCAFFSAEAGTAPPTLFTAAPEVNAARDAEVTPLCIIAPVLCTPAKLLLK